MGWIQTIIKNELRKHKTIDWTLIAEKKIIKELKDRGLYKSPNQNIELKKVYQCGDCGTLYKNKDDECCGNFKLEGSYQCNKCQMLFSENFKHQCSKESPKKLNKIIPYPKGLGF